MSFSWFWLRNIFLLVCVYLNFLLTHLKFYIGQKEDLSFQTQPWLIRPFWRIYENLALMGYQGLIIAVVSWHRAEGSWPHTQCSLIFLQFASFWPKSPPCPGGAATHKWHGEKLLSDNNSSAAISVPLENITRFWINCTRQKDLWSRVLWQLSPDELLWLTRKRKGGGDTL